MVGNQLCGLTTNGTRIGHITLLPKEEKPTKTNVGTLLYYSRAVDPTIMVALVSISDERAKSNDTTYQSIKQLLDYCTTHPYTTIIYKQSNMVIHFHSNGYYLSGYQACSQSGGHCFRGSKI